MADLTLLKGQRCRIKGSFTRLRTFVDNIPEETTAEDLVIPLEKLEENYTEFKQVDDALFANNIPSDFEEIEQKYYEIKSRLCQKLNLRPQSGNDSNDHAHEQLNSTMSRFVEQQRSFLDTFNHNNSVEVKLPKVNIPPFNGNYMDWPSFKDLFLSSIHNREGLSNTHKFQYLKGLLRDEPAWLIKHIPVTEANYTEAWEKLVLHYDKKKHILTSYIKGFINQPNCVNPSVSLLRKLTDTSDELIRGIKMLGNEANSRDPWLIYLLLNKTDSETRQAWAEEIATKEFPSFQDFLTFLTQRCDALESIEPVRKSQPVKQAVRSLHVELSIRCPKCNLPHHLFNCPNYKHMSVVDKRNFVNNSKLCFNCLSPGHRVQFCKSQHRCHLYSKLHHSSLHLPNGNISQQVSSNHSSTTEPGSFQLLNQLSSSNDILSSNLLERNQRSTLDIEINTPPKMDSYCATSNTPSKIPILPTALCLVADSSRIWQPCRLLLDSGSQASFISEECAQRLCLKRAQAKVLVSGLSAARSGYTRGKLALTLKSTLDQDQKIVINAFILDRLTTPQPPKYFPIDNCHFWEFIKGYSLADPHFNRPSKIDILLGANIDRTLRQFWETEDLPTSQPAFTEEEALCESIFTRTHKADPISGRYVVRLPFKQDNSPLGDTLSIATKQLHSLERRFRNNPHLYQEYSNFITEYRILNHLEPLTCNEMSSNSEIAYMPHHAVYKTSSTTTKLRVVFNGSAVSSFGNSLNDKLLVGPKIQRGLIHILLSFRLPITAITADIEEMYRQILVDTKDRSYQRILWRDSEHQPLQHYQLTTVTYGTSSAPFLATRCLKQLTEEFKGQYPLAAKAVSENFYVDDFLGGANSLQEALSLKDQLASLLKLRGFTLRKWTSNSQEFHNSVPIEHRSITSLRIDEHPNSIKVLGLKWIPVEDNFAFEVAAPTNASLTKRTILSEPSKIFDPLGLLSPIIISFKIMLQKLWMHDFDWDTPISTKFAQEWKKMCSTLHKLKELRIPRFVGSNHQFELHGFSDASELAFSATVYGRSVSPEGNIRVTLIAAKTRVAPVKQVGLPRLELCGALLFTNLMRFIMSNFNIDVAHCHAWTDSEVVLSWLSSHPRKWKCYIGNRTSLILSILPRSRWNHISSNNNPADLATRGISAIDLVNSTLWWNGPKLLEGNWKQHKSEPSNQHNINLAEQETRANYLEVFHADLHNEPWKQSFKSIHQLP